MSRWDEDFRGALTARDLQGYRRRLVLHGAALNFSANDYLGLSRHPALAARAAEWGFRDGTGAGASRLISGTLACHIAVETRLASLKGREAALLLGSGWQANAGVLAALLRARPGTACFVDALAHNSIIAGSRLAGIAPARFPHNDFDALDRLLAAAPEGPRLVATESVFSMDGDTADLAALATLCDRHNAFLYVDEAHATGVLGPGGGGLAHGIAGIDCVMGTLGKAIGAYGAYVAGSRDLIDFLVNRCASFIYTTAPPPPVLGAIDAALDLLPTLDSERARVLALAARLRDGLHALGFSTGASTTQIVPVMLDSAAAALALAAALERRGILAVAIRPPTVPPGTSRLRLAVQATHREADIDRLLAAIEADAPSIPEAA